MTPASLEWPHPLMPHPLWVQSVMFPSSPVHRSVSNQTRPDPSPNAALPSTWNKDEQLVWSCKMKQKSEKTGSLQESNSRLLFWSSNAPPLSYTNTTTGCQVYVAFSTMHLPVQWDWRVASSLVGDFCSVARSSTGMQLAHVRALHEFDFQRLLALSFHYFTSYNRTHIS